MKTAGIIAEYNPFHNGHLYQLQKTREMTGADFVIIVMSGDFMQRGTPALFDKYLRCRAALLGGADLVIEMPVFGSLSSAADFADCGVSLLNQTGVTDFLSFGSECGDIEALKAQEASMDISREDVSAKIRDGVKSGKTWPQARADAFFALSDAQALAAPNDILAVEYLRALKKFHSNIVPYTVPRCDDGYHSETVAGSFASATALRRAYLEGRNVDFERAVPAFLPGLLKDGGCVPVEFDDFSMLLSEKLLTSPLERLKETASMPADLAAKLFRERLNFKKAGGLTAAAKDRQYTYTRVNRALMSVILGITKEETKAFKDMDSAPWLRILGFRRSAVPLLSEMKKKAGVPMISKVADAGGRLSGPALSLFEKHLKTAELYRLAAQLNHAAGRPLPNEYTRPVIIL